jgi:hypothetical protein
MGRRRSHRRRRTVESQLRRKLHIPLEGAKFIDRGYARRNIIAKYDAHLTPRFRVQGWRPFARE